MFGISGSLKRRSQQKKEAPKPTLKRDGFLTVSCITFKNLSPRSMYTSENGCIVMSQRAPTPFPGPFSFRKQKQQNWGTFHFSGVSRLAKDTNYCDYHIAEYKTSKTGRDIMWRQTVRRNRRLGNHQSGTSRPTTTFFSL